MLNNPSSCSRSINRKRKDCSPRRGICQEIKTADVHNT